MTMFDTPTTTTTTTTKFTEAQALDWLAANPNTSKTIREIAAIWGWSRSTTQRFVSRVGQGPGTSVGQGANFAESTGTSGTSRETPETPTSGAVVAAPADYGTPIARAPYSDDFNWSPENGDVIVAPQQAIAVYRNAWGQIVIRAAGWPEDDAFVVVSPEHLPALIAKLSAILKEAD